MAHLHSVPARPHPAPCETFSGRAHPRLRPYVLGYAGFRPGDGAVMAHRILPVTSTTMIGAGGRVVTGPRRDPAVFERTQWGHGVSVGLTPLGVSALLGVPMRELAGTAVPLADLLGRGGEELAERLDAAPDWPSRFGVLDGVLAERLDDGSGERAGAADGGRIVNISTLNTVLPSPGHALYGASKAVLEQFTAVAARELGGRGITVNTVSPGATDTDLLRATNPPENLVQMPLLTALGRLGTPDDIAAVVAFLAGPDGQWITGQNIRATGGLLL